MYFVQLDQYGIVVSAGRSALPPVGAVVVHGYSGSLTELSRKVNSAHGLVDRPLSPQVQSSGHEHTISNMPLGTTVSVFDSDGGMDLGLFTADVDDMTEVISLPDPGNYQITITAPSPALQTVVSVRT